MNINQIIERWQSDPSISVNVSSWKVFPPRNPILTEFPPYMHPLVANSLTKAGINYLYQHQYESFEKILQQKNTLITSSTASGKSLCYNLPILHTLAHDADTCALYIFPTKALAHDQSHKLIKFIAGTDFNQATKINHTTPLVGIYDGDTSNPARRSIRENAQLLFTNPDMLHSGILPRHTQWSRFFSHLRFIVMDEIHIYRGVFGSHVANVIRRLKRIASYYGSGPVFILTSGTLSNSMDFARQLIGEDVSVVSSDGSPKGERYILFYNPPIVNEEFGIRVHPFREAVRLLKDLTESGLRTIIFSQSRKSVERLLIESRHALSSFDESLEEKISGYRSGYLADDRRRLETALRDGKTRTIISTNALELGIDIGDLDSTLLIGYPGTISSTWQQIARSGRKDRPSVAVLILNSTPLDQYLSKNPQYFWGRSPEQALINPNNPLILLYHLKCALNEIPINSRYPYECGDSDLLTALLYALVQQGEAIVNENNEFYSIANSSPHSFSLRSNSFKQINLVLEKDGHQLLLGQVDDQSADWLVHPGAIYLHQGETYSVNALDLDTNIAKLHPIETDYYTQPIIDTQITQFSPIEICAKPNTQDEFYQFLHGEIRLTHQVTGYTKIRWDSNQVIERNELVSPKKELVSFAFCLKINEKLIDTLRLEGLWSNDPNRYGPNWSEQKNLARKRDNYRCRLCGSVEQHRAHDVHHRIPFRSFENYLQANELDNLITLCKKCHQLLEKQVYIRSGLSGVSYALRHIAPLFAMCDTHDLGVHFEPKFSLFNNCPTIILYENIAGGIGLSQHIFQNALELLTSIYDHVNRCPCEDGCPSCIGPAPEMGKGGKIESLALLNRLVMNG